MPVIGYPKIVRDFALCLACLSLAGVGSASALAQGGIFQFGLIGDMPYTTVQQQEYQRVLAALNKADLAFVVHIGDFQNDPRGLLSKPSHRVATLPR